MRPILLAAALVAVPANALTSYGTYLSYGYANWPGYFDGVSGASFQISLKDDLAIGDTRVLSLSDLSSISAGWGASMRVSPIGPVYTIRQQFWQASIADITSFTATVQGVPGRIQLLSAFLTTGPVIPFSGDAGLGATQLEITEGGYTFWNADGMAFGQVMANAPESSTWVLLLAGFGMAGFGLRRQRHKIAAVNPA